MRAAILTTLNAPLEIWDLDPIPAAHDNVCGNGQVLVDVTASGICGSQLQEIAGNKGNANFVPHMLGHEGVGVVRTVGPGVSTSLGGRKVVMHWRKGAGPEAFFPARYKAAGTIKVGAGHITTLCQSAIVSANRVTVVPDDVPDELCALLGCGLSTAIGTIEQEARVKMGESVLIVGCGGVGLNLIQAARLACAYPIVGMDIHEEKREVVKKLGAHFFVNCKGNNPPPYCGLGRFDVIIDTSGSIEAIEDTIPLLAEGGRFVLVGQPKPGEGFRVNNALEMFMGEQGKHIIATQGGGFRPSVMIPRYINLWRAGLLDLDSIISHRIGLQEINDGVELVRKGQAGRILVMMR